ncbi:hypothetical protein M758_3G080700 [Ceratodon purpureus]|nr:hypothetical protein M758_3G080700 [Ceratodon purpureus]
MYVYQCLCTWPAMCMSGFPFTLNPPTPCRCAVIVLCTSFSDMNSLRDSSNPWNLNHSTTKHHQSYPPYTAVQFTPQYTVQLYYRTTLRIPNLHHSNARTRHKSHGHRDIDPDLMRRCRSLFARQHDDTARQCPIAVKHISTSPIFTENLGLGVNGIPRPVTSLAETLVSIHASTPVIHVCSTSERKANSQRRGSFCSDQ